MSPFLDAVLKLALTGFVIKFLWDAFVKLPQEKLEKQVEFLIARYLDLLLIQKSNLKRNEKLTTPTTSSPRFTYCFNR